MEVKIEMIPKMNTNIDFAIHLKNIVKDLIQTCTNYGVSELTYVHDYFKIHIKQPIKILQQDFKPLINHIIGEENDKENT